MNRLVRGILFVDYVRMMRGQKHVDWSTYLQPEDYVLLSQRIDPQGWYPMETFERMGIGIVRELARGQLAAVRLWGSIQFDVVHAVQPTILAPGDPRESMMRFNTLRRALFDYDALEVTEVLDDAATVAVQYGMSPEAEEAACHQTLGFFERLVEAAGGRDVKARFSAMSWHDGPRTTIDLHWT